ncbi:MAG: hypothetical protein K2X87_12680, partial [Gemmataceae bacterium]|nr:hypothetical protein [Gemmataceae bacterium]
MRSIRRSLLGYLLLLVALALGAVGVLLDRLAVGALRDREQAEAERINHVIEGREKEVQKKFDAELLTEARALSQEMQLKLLEAAGVSRGAPRGPDGTPRTTAPPRQTDFPPKPTEAEVAEFGHRAAVLPLVAPPGLGTWAAVAATGRNQSPAWSAFEAPRSFARNQIAEVLRKEFVDDGHPGYFQFDVVVEYPGLPARRHAVVHPARIGPAWPPDPDPVGRPDAARPDPDPRPDHLYDEVEVPGQGLFRR